MFIKKRKFRNVTKRWFKGTTWLFLESFLLFLYWIDSYWEDRWLRDGRESVCHVVTAVESIRDMPLPTTVCHLPPTSFTTSLVSSSQLISTTLQLTHDSTSFVSLFNTSKPSLDLYQTHKPSLSFSYSISRYGYKEWFLLSSCCGIGWVRDHCCVMELLLCQASQSLVRFHDLWLAKDNRFLNPKSSYERILRNYAPRR